jgi:hypothetical protein
LSHTDCDISCLSIDVGGTIIHPTTNTGIRDKFWQRLVVEDAGYFPQPDFALVDGIRIETASARWRTRVPTDLGEALLSAPGSYILKPRFGSNGFCVVRIVSANGSLSVESDCPDTSRYLEELPRSAELRGRELVVAVATHRSRFIDRATAGLPEQTLDQSILEEEIRQDRADGSIFEPRIVVQRIQSGSGERFATLGAICKRIDTAVGASVASDFREEPLDTSLCCFLRDRVPNSDLASRVAQTRDAILAVGDRIREKLVPLIESRARVHQFGIDCRLCWNAATGEVEYPFLEFQFGIGRIDQFAPAGYKTRAELRALFGSEVG